LFFFIINKVGKKKNKLEFIMDFFYY
jgi:hypothetical protein